MAKLIILQPESLDCNLLRNINRDQLLLFMISLFLMWAMHFRAFADYCDGGVAYVEMTLHLPTKYAQNAHEIQNNVLNLNVFRHVKDFNAFRN